MSGELSLAAADLLTGAQALCFTGQLARCEPAAFRYRVCVVAPGSCAPAAAGRCQQCELHYHSPFYFWSAAATRGLERRGWANRTTTANNSATAGVLISSWG
jgi:hypothetical protein